MSVIWQQNGEMQYLVSQQILAPHCFTSRLGGVSTGYLSALNLGAHRGDTLQNLEENYTRLANALGFSLSNLVLTRQTHSDIVRPVGLADAGLGLDHSAYPECDALVTNTPSVALAVFTADCTPILLWDSQTGAVGAVHAGWRGTAAGIAAKTVQEMVRRYGCQPKNIHAAIGPNIGFCCFETDADVPHAMIGALGKSALPYIRRQEQKYYVNLKAMNALFLQEAGVHCIEISEECTACDPHRFWSHRITQGQRGSQGAIIVCKEAAK